MGGERGVVLRKMEREGGTETEGGTRYLLPQTREAPLRASLLALSCRSPPCLCIWICMCVCLKLSLSHSRAHSFPTSLPLPSLDITPPPLSPPHPPPHVYSVYIYIPTSPFLSLPLYLLSFSVPRGSRTWGGSWSSWGCRESMAIWPYPAHSATSTSRLSSLLTPRFRFGV